MTDARLLESFVARRDEAAFAALVQRHGPMVLGTCRRVLRDPHDAEDAFQAAFLVLVRKADSIRRRELLGNWLYGVAYRQRLDDGRPPPAGDGRGKAGDEHAPSPRQRDEDVGRELRPLLDAELHRPAGKLSDARGPLRPGGQDPREAARSRLARRDVVGPAVRGPACWPSG